MLLLLMLTLELDTFNYFKRFELADVSAHVSAHIRLSKFARYVH